MTTIESVEPTAQRGRPRSEKADRDILAAALDVLAEAGAAGFSVEAVAQRAGVSKTTIYRRFPGAHDLLAEALSTLNDDLPAVPQCATARDSLIALLNGMRTRAVDTRADRCLPQVMSQAQQNPDLFEIYHDRVVEARRDRIRSILRRGIEAGELRDDVDIELLASMFTAPMIWMTMATPPSRRRVDDQTSQQLVDALLQGVAAH